MQVQAAPDSESESESEPEPEPSAMEPYLLNHGLTLVKTFAFDAHTDGRSVVVAAHKDGRSMVIKLIRDTEKEFERERDFAMLCAEFDLAPALIDSRYDSWSECGFLMLECWPHSLDQLFASGLHLLHDNLMRIANELKRLLHGLHQLGLVHADLLPKNVVCRLCNDRVERLALIDFGITFQIDEVGKNLLWPDFHVLLTYIYDPLNWKSMSVVRPKYHDLLLDPHMLDAMLLKYILFLQANLGRA